MATTTVPPQTQLSQLFRHLVSETSRLEQEIPPHYEPQGYAPDMFVTSVRLDKLAVNMDRARSMVLDLERQPDHLAQSSSNSFSANFLRRNQPNISSTPPPDSGVHQFRQLLKKLNDRIQHMQHTVRRTQEHEARLYNEEKQAIAAQSLRQRKNKEEKVTTTDTGKSSATLTMEEKVAVQQNIQEEISDGILDMVAQLKANAERFNEKMNEDQNVVDSTAKALDRTSGRMSNVGSKLSKYQRTTALGWKFYIIASIFMMLALVMGMTIIRLFPKW